MADRDIRVGEKDPGEKTRERESGAVRKIRYGIIERGDIPDRIRDTTGTLA